MIRDQSLGMKGGFFISSLRLTEIVKKASLVGSKDIQSKEGVKLSNIVENWFGVTRTCPPYRHFLGHTLFPTRLPGEL